MVDGSYKGKGKKHRGCRRRSPSLYPVIPVQPGSYHTPPHIHIFNISTQDLFLSLIDN